MTGSRHNLEGIAAALVNPIQSLIGGVCIVTGDSG
jgi:hypothetical protein